MTIPLVSLLPFMTGMADAHQETAWIFGIFFLIVAVIVFLANAFGDNAYDPAVAAVGVSALVLSLAFFAFGIYVWITAVAVFLIYFVIWRLFIKNILAAFGG